MKPCKPHLLDSLPPVGDIAEAVANAREREEDIQHVRVSNVCLSDLDAYKIGFTGVEFDHCRLNAGVFDKASFVDVRFRDCDFSASSFSDAYFSRCEFLTSKWVGAVFSGVMLRQSMAHGCSFQYANFDSASLQSSALRECDCTGAVFSNAALRQVETADNKLTAVNFFHTPLKGMDFTRDLVEGWILSEGLSELKGAIFRPFQAADLALLLGIQIKNT